MLYNKQYLFCCRIFSHSNNLLSKQVLFLFCFLSFHWCQQLQTISRPLFFIKVITHNNPALFHLLLTSPGCALATLRTCPFVPESLCWSGLCSLPRSHWPICLRISWLSSAPVLTSVLKPSLTHSHPHVRDIGDISLLDTCLLPHYRVSAFSHLCSQHLVQFLVLNVF